ncbi:YSIRK-type signal peptide-containing protein [Ligilactobacillus salivarius]|uniref:YSIRK-type signal peptide-containing protein n=2 Tax=Ligilactobacillus salivarius TaxID=1624 RepID=A0ABD7YVN2_9LACO|nr:YSIRK-type signal peptide-containing protein [Ligilactobacillus salivarius]WHS08463.1 YSIRK-type signal peptide-containing protein [Ligilactobacillus salivarius]WHS09373.1 YSIRK-type signal peptide-containing protein [Ligilactobacillus salivarius]WHS13313.1 YSIRK-type signal peptide-containing protein [Ligilactobacillus salivarius]WHS18066.1 YSIRK-type signal peptide-containing protein [Ligilactobacillus salivarius]WHS19545.1 YSIRK-type signal peptide-containing protein [Ligilactobacillus s
MVSRNNTYMKERKSNNRINRFSIRKTSVGVLSVTVASLFYLYGITHNVQADVIQPSTSVSSESQTNDINSENNSQTITTVNDQTTKDSQDALREAKQNLDNAVEEARQQGVAGVENQNITVERSNDQVTDISTDNAQSWVENTTADYNNQANEIRNKVAETKQALEEWQRKRAEQEANYNPNQAIAATNEAYVENSFNYNSTAEAVNVYRITNINGQEVQEKIPFTNKNGDIIQNQEGKLPRNFNEDDGDIRIIAKNVTKDTKLKAEWKNVIVDTTTGKHYDLVIEITDAHFDERFNYNKATEGEGWIEFFRDPASGILFDRITVLKLTKYLVETGTDNIYEGEDYFTQDSLNRQIPTAEHQSTNKDPNETRAEFVKPIDGSIAAFVPTGSVIMPTPFDISDGNSSAKRAIEELNQERSTDKQLAENVYISKGYDNFLDSAVESIVFLTKGKASFLLGTINPVTKADADDLFFATEPKVIWKDYSQVGLGILDKSKFVSHEKPVLTYHYDVFKTTEKANVERNINYVYGDQVKDKSQPLPDKVTQNATYTRTATVDYAQYLQDKTGQNYTSWETTDDVQSNFTNVSTPVKKGYYADIANVEGVTSITVDNSGKTNDVHDVTVTYNELGQFIPQTEDGKEIVPNEGGSYRKTYENDPSDPTKVSRTEYPQIPGYHVKNGDTGEMPQNPGEDTPVVYIANDQRLQLRVFDDNKNEQLLTDGIAETDYIGKSNADYPATDINNSLEKLLTYYQQRGYKLNGEMPSAEGKFDTNDDVTQYIDLHLSHDTETVTTNKGNDEKINKDDPNSPVYPSEAQDIVRDASQEVTYSGAGDKTPKAKKESVKDALKRTVTIDKVTGEVLSKTDWSTHEFSSVPSEHIKGFTVDKENAGAGVATVDNPVVEDNVVYTPDYQKLIIRAYDKNDTDKVVEISVPNSLTTVIEGTTGEKVNIDKDITNIKDALAKEGYSFDSQTDIPALFDDTDNLDKNDKQPQYVDLYFIHKIIPVPHDNPQEPDTPIKDTDKNYPNGVDKESLNTTVSRKINYVYGENVPDKKGQQVYPSKNQDVSYYRDAKVDVVTGDVTYDEWKSDSNEFAEVVSPKLDGYTASKEVVEAATVTKDSNGVPENAEDVTVIYTANEHTVKIKYVDDDNNGEQVGTTKDLTGKTGETVTPEYEIPANYEYVGGEEESYTFGATDKDNNDIIVHLKHETQVISEAQEYKFIVHYQAKDGVEVPADNVQTSTWTRTVTVDKVDGHQVSVTPWETEDNYHEVVTPEIAQHYADKKVVSSETKQADVTEVVEYSPMGHIIPVDENNNPIPNVENPQYNNDPEDPTKGGKTDVPEIPGYTPEVTEVTPEDPGKDTPVVYTANEHTVKIKYVDDDNNGEQVGTTKDLTGKTGETVTPEYEIPANYEYVGGEEESYTFGATDKDNHDIIVHLKHETQVISEAQEYKFIVHYQAKDGVEVPADNVQTSTWTRTVTVDKVDGHQVSVTPWETEDNYHEVVTPEIAQHYADKKVVSSETKQADVTEVVEYSPMGHIIPVDENNNPIPNVENPQYNNDPEDPTKGGKTDVPEIPGYTPEVTEVTPEDPGKDTPVVYTANEQKAEVVYIDADDGNKVIARSGVLTGKSGSHIDYSVDQVLTDLINKKYELVNNGFPADAKFDNDSDNDQIFKVIVKHDPSEVTQVETHTLTIHYVSTDGSDVPSDNVQVSTWKRGAMTDLVTGEIHKVTPWVSDIKQYNSVNIPVIKGYYADIALVPSRNVEQKDIMITVTYRPLGHVIPVDENGTTIPNVDNPQYTNDPEDPTKGGKTDVPEIPGYTPEVTEIVPGKSGEDTKVVYKTHTNSQENVKVTPTKDNNNNVKHVFTAENRVNQETAVNKDVLPQTGDKEENHTTLVGAMLVAISSLLGLSLIDRKKDK